MSKQEKKIPTKPDSQNPAVTSKEKKAVQKKMAIPQTVQATIPYIAVYKNGIIETTPNCYTKTYILGDANFAMASQEDQKAFSLRYQEFLNMFTPETNFQINIFNRKVDEVKIANEVFLKRRRDGLDEYRDEMNAILRDKIAEGQNNLVKEKYLTVSVISEDIETAVATFNRMDSEIASVLKPICDRDVRPMTIEERLNLLYDVYNADSTVPFNGKTVIDGEESRAFTLDILEKYGLTSKDIIGPESIQFQRDYCILGDRYVRILYVNSYPTFLSTDFLANVTDTSFTMLTSINYEALHQDKVMKMLHNQLVNIDGNVIKYQQRAGKSGYSGNILPPTLQHSRDSTKKLIDDLTNNNQKLFYGTVTFAVFADSLEDLNKHTSAVISTGGRYLVNIRKLNYQQEYGLTSTLPFSNNKLAVQRFLTTEAAALFIPFTSQELYQKGGFYYGLNGVSKNLILYNRTLGNNTNGLILGTPGSGKSFGAKREMLNVILNTDDDVFVIDPDREYTPMAKALGGQVINIAAGSPSCINPFDMNLEYGDSGDPIALKSDYIISLCETIISGRYGLSPMQKTIVDRCVKEIYIPYLEHMRTQKLLGKESDIDTDKSPTMVDFYNALLAQPEPEAKNLALALELYATGSLDTFAHKTNIETNSRFVVYDIKDIGTGLKELGLQVCLNDVWNRTIANKQLGKRTWFYIDEFYILIQNESSAQFVQQIFKRARKWGGCPTGITQNVEDMLSTKEGRTMISNSEFILMFKQSPLDGADLAEMFNISPAQLNFITNSSPGQGLMYNGKTLIPFSDQYPTDTKTFKIMTTKFEDARARNTNK